jgi:hypothetical protein
VALACTLPPALFFLLAGVCLGSAGLLLSIVAGLLAVPAFISGRSFLLCRAQTKRAQQALEEAQRLAAEQIVFMTSARGGRFLSMVARRHPLLRTSQSPSQRSVEQPMEVMHTLLARR